MVWLKFFPYVESIANLMPVVMLAVGGVFLIRGELTMGDYVAFSGLIWAIANPMRQMGNIMNEFQRFSAASKKVMEIYYSEPQIKDALMQLHTRTALTGKSNSGRYPFSMKMGIFRCCMISLLP